METRKGGKDDSEVFLKEEKRDGKHGKIGKKIRREWEKIEKGFKKKRQVPGPRKVNKGGKDRVK